MLKITKLSQTPNADLIENLYKIHTSVMPDKDQMSRQSFFDEFYLSPNRVYLVATSDEKVVGYLGALDIIDDYNIVGVAVDNSYQRKGIGTKLLKALIKIANNHQVQTLSLEVDEKNEKAINFYKKNGFELTNIRKNYYKDNDALIMWLYLWYLSTKK